MKVPKIRPLQKIPTGIRGFDDILEGGLPKARVLLVAGAAGTGKTVLMNEFLYRGIERFGERGVLVTFEERPEDIMRNMASFGWDYAALMNAGKLAIVDASPDTGSEEELGPDYDLTPLLLQVKQAVKRTGARRVALDSLEALFLRWRSNAAQVRRLLFQIGEEAKRLGVTMMMSAESTPGGALRFGVEDFVADGVVELTHEAGQQQSTIRRILVRKLRGAGYRSTKVEFAIQSDGLSVYPKLAVDRRTATTSLDVRKRFGVEKFDAILAGGIPQGYLMLLSGNTGTGKSTFAQHFVVEGVRQGESSVFVALEEPSGQVRALAASHGWDFAGKERRRKLRILDVPLIDIRADEVISRIARAVHEIGAKRIVIDSISSMRSASMGPEEVRQFLIQLGEYVKAQGLTCVMTYLVPGVFGAEKGQLLPSITTSDVRLSSAVDGVLIQRYVERGQRVKKLLTVLKLRGTAHDRAIYTYDIGAGGVVMGDKFEE